MARYVAIPLTRKQGLRMVAAAVERLAAVLLEAMGDRRLVDMLLGELPRVTTRRAFERELRAVRRRMIERFPGIVLPAIKIPPVSRNLSFCEVADIPEGFHVRDRMTGIHMVKRGGLEPVI